MGKLLNPVDRHVGSRVRMRRMTLHMSQEKLGDALNITFQQVQKYEKGTNRISASRLHQIAEIMQVPVAFFFEEAPGQFKPNGKDQGPDYVADFLSTADGLRLAKAFMGLTSSTRRSIVGLVQEIADRSSH